MQGVIKLIAGLFAVASVVVWTVEARCQASTITTPETSTSLRVMTYNIRTGKAQDGLDRWEVRKTRTIQLLKKYQPELLGLQEALADQITDLEVAMPGYAVVGTGRADGRNGSEFSPIMYDTTRLHLLRSDTFWLSDTPEVPGSLHWGNMFSRICTWGYFQDRKTGKFFYHFNTHLDHMSQPSRVKSADLILDRVKGILPKDAVVITGDFNAGENNPVVKSVLAAGYDDTFRLLHPDEKVVGTTNAFQEERQPNKIDYVFIDNNWEANAAAIPDDKYDGRWPSDHLPVTATLTQK